MSTKRKISFILSLENINEKPVINNKNVTFSKIEFQKEIINEKENNIYFILVGINFEKKKEDKLNILINKNIFILNIRKSKNEKGIDFLFNEEIIDEKNNKRLKLNQFSIEEEFLYFNKFIDRIEKNIGIFDTNYKIKENFKRFTISSTRTLLEKKEKTINFVFVVNIIITFPDEFKINKDVLMLLEKMRNIDSIGDLSKIDKAKINSILKHDIFKPILIIYYLLEEFDEFLKNKETDKNLLFKCLNDYNLLFFKSQTFLSKLSELIIFSDCMEHIKIVLKFIKKFPDFIEFIYTNRDYILKIYNINKNERIILTEYFNFGNEFKDKIDESFFLL